MRYVPFCKHENHWILGVSGNGQIWLIFGEKHEEYDFLYKNELQKWALLTFEVHIIKYLRRNTIFYLVAN